MPFINLRASDLIIKKYEYGGEIRTVAQIRSQLAHDENFIDECKGAGVREYTEDAEEEQKEEE